MPTDFKLPDLGENINSAEVLKVLVAPGDTVAKEQGLIEVETDKATIEVPCNIAGTVTAIHVKDGDTIAPGQVIVTLDAVDAPQVASPTPEPTAEPETK